MKVALIGLGGVAERIHLPAVASLRGLTLVGAVEPSPETARRVGERWSIPVVLPGVEGLLEKTKPDLVIVGSPPHAHFENVRDVLERGAHVLCEKPFASTIEEADELIALARKTGRLLAVNNQYRYMEPYAEVARRLASGEIGPLYQAQVWQQMFHPPERETNWRAALSRYTLFEFGTHPLDLLSLFFGSHPIAVTARTPRVPHGHASDVLAVALLDYPGGGVATLNLHRVSRAPERYLEMRLDTREASLRVSLGGVARASLDWSKSRGRPILRASLVRGGEARLERDGRSRVLARSPRSELAPATARHLSHLVERIQRGDVVPSAAIHAREVLRTVFAAYESAETGATVRLAPAGDPR
jgi:predicted dehydrogenase